jgi:hypothetical protein
MRLSEQICAPVIDDPHPVIESATDWLTADGPDVTVLPPDDMRAVIDRR